MQRISERDLATLIAREVDRARAAGQRHVRDVHAFQAHLIDVAVRAEHVACGLRAVLPAREAPDPVVAFVAGAWHDGGKIRLGDDYHEITSAVDILERGAEWALVTDRHDTAAVLARAAMAVLPGFALYEQWQPTYVPTWTPRAQVEAAYEQLAATLAPSLRGAERDRVLLLPRTTEALVVMYSDMCNIARRGQVALEFDTPFEQRWTDVERRARLDDPGLLSVLPAARPRVREGCALVHGWLTAGFDAAALARFRAVHCAGLGAAR